MINPIISFYPTNFFQIVSDFKSEMIVPKHIIRLSNNVSQKYKCEVKIRQQFQFRNLLQRLNNASSTTIKRKFLSRKQNKLSALNMKYAILCGTQTLFSS